VVSLDEAPDRRRLRVLEDVVAQADDDVVVAGEALGHPDHLRDPARLDLHLVGQIEIEERCAVAALAQSSVSEQIDHLAGVTLAGDDHHLLHPRELAQLQGVEDHRPVAHREQVLVDDARQLAQPGRLATRRDQSLCPHAADDATPGPARGVRSRSQNESSTTGPIPTAKTSVPIPTVPPSRKPTTRTAISSPVRAAPSLMPSCREVTSIRESRGPAPIE